MHTAHIIWNISDDTLSIRTNATARTHAWTAVHPSTSPTIVRITTSPLRLSHLEPLRALINLPRPAKLQQTNLQITQHAFDQTPSFLEMHEQIMPEGVFG